MHGSGSDNGESASGLQSAGVRKSSAGAIDLDPNDMDRVYNFLPSSLVPDLSVIAKLFKLGTVSNKGTVICKVLMILYESERNGGRNWPELVGAKHVDWMKSLVKLSKTFYLCPEEIKLTSGQPESLERRAADRAAPFLDVSASDGARFNLDELARLCAILFRNAETTAALLKSGEYFIRLGQEGIA